MDWHNEDPFDSIFKEFFGQGRAQRKRYESFTQGEEEERTIDVIETPDHVFLIFEIPGFNLKDIAVTIKERRLEVKAQKQSASQVQEYLLPRLRQGITIKKTLPADLDPKSLSYSYKHGILEVQFNKHG